MNVYFRLVLVVVLLAVPALACQTLTGSPVSAPAAPTVQQTLEPVGVDPVSIPLPDLVSVENQLTSIYAEASMGVVAIRVLTASGDGLGSGFVYDKEGHIITNYHVIQGVTDLEVDFPSGLKVRGQVIGTDLDSDLAVIVVDVDPDYLYPLRLGNSETLQVGQTVVAIGNPFGLSGSMTVGIVSALGRTLDSMHASPEGSYFTAGDLIQTDTAINPGNSGGPLLNLQGEVVGINRAIRTESFSTIGEPVNSGIGFAIAVNLAKRVVPSLIENQSYDYPYMGILSIDEITLLRQEALGLSRATGAYITAVTAGGPAERAGLRGGSTPTNLPGLQAGGDLIIAVDGNPVLSFSDMLSYILNYKSPGDIVILTILRDNREMEVELSLGKRPN